MDAFLCERVGGTHGGKIQPEQSPVRRSAVFLQPIGEDVVVVFPVALTDRVLGLQTQMPEGEQSVERIFAIDRVIGPVAVKCALIGPQGIHEIQAHLLDRFEIVFQTGQRVQCRCR